MKLVKWAAFLEGEVKGEKDIEIQGLSEHSREVQKGDLFFAIPGKEKDGKFFIPEAFQKGALAAVCEPPCPSFPGNYLLVKDVRKALAKAASLFYRFPTKKLLTLGITGTNGKTTTSYLLSSILEEAGHPTALLGTTGYRVGGRWEEAKNTTPSSLKIQSLAAKALYAGEKALVMEVSSHALCQKRVDEVHFQGAIFTNLTRDHLDYHGSFENYRQAKAKLFSLLPKDGIAVLSGEDSSTPFMASNSKAPIVRYGIGNGFDYSAKELKLSLKGSEFLLFGKNFTLPIRLPLVGRHNVMNALAAASLAAELGIHPGFIQSGLEKAPSVPGRLESIPNTSGLYVFVDYAHTPDALERVLACLASLTSRPIWTIFGCGGNRDKGKRPLMGQVSERYSHWTILTSDNPRWEAPEEILKQIAKGMKTKNYTVITDREEAIRCALCWAKPGDVVLIAGKGHETYQEIQGIRYPFHDRKVAEKYLKQIGQKAA